MNKDLERLRGIADYQFGYGAGLLLFPDDTRIEYSKNTSRPRHIYAGGVMVANYRPTDAVFTITIAGAVRLNKLEGFTGYVVVVDEVLEFIENGKNLLVRVSVQMTRLLSGTLRVMLLLLEKLYLPVTRCYDSKTVKLLM